MTSIETMRKQATRFLLFYLWAHLPVIAGAGLLLSGEWLMPCLGALVLAGAATLACGFDDQAAGRFTISVALMGMVALLMYQFQGRAWQVDMHMYFFAALAMLTVLCDWQALVLAAGAVAAHHLLLNFAYPAAVYPAGASFARVILHAVIVVIETAVLSWGTERLAQAFAAVEKAANDTRLATLDAKEAAQDRDRLAHDADARRKVEMNALADLFQADLGKVADALSKTATTARKGAEDFNVTLDRMNVQTAAAAASVTEVAANVGTVAATAEELSGSVREVNRRIDQSSAMARSAVDEVERTNATVEGLVQAADRIGDVVSLIQDIASQTNLLALNATIEAARAGDAGKGFAVVAGEVKHLANQTAKATEEISAQIAAIQSVTGGAVKAMKDIGGTISGIDEAVSTIAGSAEAQTAAIGKIALCSEQVAAVTQKVSHNIEGLSEVARGLEQMSSDRISAATALVDQAELMSQRVGEFVVRVRAG